MEPQNNSQDNDANGVLTSIHATYTLSNTEECGNEVDRLAVKQFLNALAEIALAIASRKGKEIKQ